MCVCVIHLLSIGGLITLLSALLYTRRIWLYNTIMTQHSLYNLADDTATRLTPPGIHSGMDITIQNVDSSAYVFLGGEGVTSSDYGFRVSPGAAISFELPGRDVLFAISDTDGSSIAVLKTNLESGN